MSARTRLLPPPQVTVNTLSVRVLEGPDRGGSLASESEILTVGTADGNTLVLSDDAVSRYHLELRCSEHGVEVHDLGSTNGTRFMAARLENATVPLGSRLNLGNTTLELHDGKSTTIELHNGDALAQLVGDTAEMRRVMAQIRRVAVSEVPTLLMGESGTGKEVVARSIHELSARREQPFVTVDCGAFAPNLVASELFGHERGAFTGADRQHVGAFERAHGGTIFLDEIGELPLELQPQLLGALERRRFRRIGGREDIDVDVQLVSATNRDLRKAVNKGSFRLDLYYRLAVVVLRLPPLRQRLDDLPTLIAHFLRESDHTTTVEEIVTPEVMKLLVHHDWPGNVRELRNWVDATLAMGEVGELVAEPMSQRRSGTNDLVLDPLLTMPYKDARAVVLQQFESRYLKNLIESARHNVSEASRRADMDRSYLVKLLQRHKLR